jgi:hypothetical protein
VIPNEIEVNNVEIGHAILLTPVDPANPSSMAGQVLLWNMQQESLPNRPIQTRRVWVLDPSSSSFPVQNLDCGSNPTTGAPLAEPAITTDLFCSVMATGKGKPWIIGGNGGGNTNSSAVLLQDGRVLAIGGTDKGMDKDPITQIPWSGVFPNNSFEIFSPPYLFQGTRPRLFWPQGVQPVATYGQVFTVRGRAGTAAGEFCLIRTAARTHHQDSDQRHIKLFASPAAIDTTTG